jgi:hypothetical protein
MSRFIDSGRVNNSSHLFEFSLLLLNYIEKYVILQLLLYNAHTNF